MVEQNKKAEKQSSDYLEELAILPRDKRLNRIGTIAVINYLALSQQLSQGTENSDYFERLDLCKNCIEFFGTYSVSTYSTIKIFRQVFENAHHGIDEDFYSFCADMINDPQNIYSNMIGGDITLEELKGFPIDQESIEKIFSN